MRTDLLKTGFIFSLAMLLGLAQLPAQMPSMGSNPNAGGGNGLPMPPFRSPQLAPVYAPDNAMSATPFMGASMTSPQGMPLQPAMGGPGMMAPPIMAMNNQMAPEGQPGLLPEQEPEGGYPAGPIAYPGQDAGGPMIDPGAPPCDGTSAAPCNSDGRWASPYADHDPIFGLYAFSEVAAWRGIPTGSFPSNNGIVEGINAAAPLPFLGQYGFGAQLGGSYGAYNFSGHSAVTSSNEVTQQAFLTGGFYRRADCDRRLSGGIVYDVMWNDNFGAYNAAPTLTQFRAQLGYAIGYWNEIGFWGTHRDMGSTNAVTIPPLALQQPAYFRGISQINIYWHHKWGVGGADTTLYFGVPDRIRLTDPNFRNITGNLGNYILGATMNVPINNCLALYGNGTYMRPTTPLVDGSFGAIAGSWNVAFGIQYYPGKGARSSTVAGRSAMPYMPVANNGSFLTNTNRTQ
jgi:hypothetical protein